MSPEQISSISTMIGRQVTGNGMFTMSDYAMLSSDQKAAITNQTRQYILDNPTLFTTTQVSIAQRAGNLSENPVETYGVGDALSDFTDEVGNQIVDLNESLNPFSESNRKWVLGVVIAGVAIYFLAPVVIDALRKAKK